jgi:hypothetical protein
MNNVINIFLELPRISIAWQLQRNPAGCRHEFEVIAIVEEGGVIRRCIWCRSLEDV